MGEFVTFKKGHGKVLGSGRKRGQKNKRSLVFDAILDFKNFDMVSEAIDLFRSLGSSLDEKELKAKILLGMLPYGYPKLTAPKEQEKTPEELELEGMSIEELARRAAPIVLQKGVGYATKLESKEQSKVPPREKTIKESVED
jgi:hypothetical protein